MKYILTIASYGEVALEDNLKDLIEDIEQFEKEGHKRDAMFVKLDDGENVVEMTLPTIRKKIK